MAPGDVIFVVNPEGWNREFKSWPGVVGQYLQRVNAEVLVRIRGAAPQPGVPPRNRTRMNYATGELAMSHVPDYGTTPSGDLEARVVALAPHAILVARGTVPHEIKPKVAPKMVFFWPKAGRVVRLSKVNHPGTAANTYMADELEGAIRVLR